MSKTWRRLTIIVILIVICAFLFACNKTKTSYTVSFATDGGTHISDIRVDPGSDAILLPADPTRDGYVFGGWYTDWKRTIPLSSDSLLVESNITLYAKWIPAIPAPVSYEVTLTFDSMGANAIADMTIASTDTALSLPTPEMQPYIFGGWYIDKDVWHTPFTLNLLESVSQKTTFRLYARWVATFCAHEFEVDNDCLDRVCKICGETIPASIAHDYVAEVVEGSCMKVGFIRYTCSICGDTYDVTDTVEYAHEAGSPADCTHDQICKICGEVVEHALGHSGNAADCTHASLCVRCGIELAPALGHLPGSDPTCTVGRYCGRCHELLEPPLGHSYSDEYTVDVAPKCLESGFESRHCSRCQAYTDRREIPPAGHSPAGEATCTDPVLCEVCGAQISPALGHQFVGEEIPPTNADNGYTLYTCRRCGARYTSDPTSALGYPLTYFAGADNVVGDIPSTQYVAKGSQIFLPVSSLLQRQGYIFAGWSNGHTVYPGGTQVTMPGSAVTYTAVWLDEKYIGWSMLYTSYDVRNIALRLDGQYVLLNDINLNDTWVPIGDASHAFSGIFDGNGHVIYNFDLVEQSATSFFGFFGKVTGKVENLTLSDFTITSGDGYTYCGGLTGFLEGIVRNCHVTNCTIRGKVLVGGIAATAFNSKIDFCSATSCALSASDDSGENVMCGGLVAYANNTSIRDCHTSGSMSCVGTATAAGGLVGTMYTGSTIERSYSAVRVILCYSTDRLAYAGGLVGLQRADTSITSCFATTSMDLNTTNLQFPQICSGQLVGNWLAGDVTNCYYTDTQTVTIAGTPSEFTTVIGEAVSVQTLYDEDFLQNELGFQQYFAGVIPGEYVTNVWVFRTDALPVIYSE